MPIRRTPIALMLFASHTYVPLALAAPPALAADAKACKTAVILSKPSRGDPKVREAAHHGLQYLARASREWTRANNCFGCHVQAVTLEALASGKHHQYDVGDQDIGAMLRALKLGVTAGGRVTGAAFQGAAWARYDRWIGKEHSKDLLLYANELVELQQASGAVVDDDARRPVTGGTMQTTFQAAQTWRQAYARTADEKWLRPLRRAESYLAEVARSWKDSGEDAYIQDINFALLGLVASGAGSKESSALRLQRMLLARQNQDGGFGLDHGASDAFATGQTIYALKLAGYADTDAPIARGLRYLLSHQERSGAWRTYKSNQGGAEKGETMWAVLGLVTVDVASVTVSGLADGEHVTDPMTIAISAADNQGGGIARVDLLVDDLPLASACGDKLTHSWKTTDLKDGMHVVDVIATNAKGQESRRRFEVYAGNVFMTHVAADFDETAEKTIVTLRDIAPFAGDKSAVALEVFEASNGADPKPGARIFATEKASVPGPMTFEWAGLGEDGKPRPRGRYLAKLSFRDAAGKIRQSETALFFHDRESVQKKRFGEVEGQLSLRGGLGTSANTVVELVDESGRVVQTTRTTDQGNYRFKNVNAGAYKVRAKKEGFQDLERRVETKADSAPASAPMGW